MKERGVREALVKRCEEVLKEAVNKVRVNVRERERF